MTKRLQDRNAPTTPEDLYGTTITIDKPYMIALGGGLLMVHVMLSLAMLASVVVGGLIVFQILTDTAPLWWWIISAISLSSAYWFGKLSGFFLNRIRLLVTGQINVTDG